MKEEEGDPATVVPELLVEAMSKFMDYYKPVDDYDEPYELMSTIEIKQSLDELLCEDSTTKDQLYKIMIENGFKYKYIDGFKWLLSIKRKAE